MYKKDFVVGTGGDVGDRDRSTHRWEGRSLKVQKPQS